MGSTRSAAPCAGAPVSRPFGRESLTRIVPFPYIVRGLPSPRAILNDAVKSWYNDANDEAAP